MPTNDYRLGQISTADVSPGASATVTIFPKRGIQSDAIDGDEPRGQVLIVALTNPERQSLRGIIDRAAARMDFRRAAKALDPAIELSLTQLGEP